MNANEMFQKKYNGEPNFITPKIYECLNITPNRAYELSGERYRLTDVFPPLFGVTVLDYDPATDTIQHNRELSKPFHSIREARQYIQQLKEEADR